GTGPAPRARARQDPHARRNARALPSPGGRAGRLTRPRSRESAEQTAKAAAPIGAAAFAVSAPWAGRASGDGGAVLIERGVDAVLVVDLAAGDRRVEDAHHAHLVLRADRVLVVLVQQVHRAVAQLVDLAGLLVRDRAGAAHAVH